MLYVPFILGVCVAGELNTPALLLLAATTALFISRESLLTWYRSKLRGRTNLRAARLLVIYLAITFLCGIPLLLVYRLYWLLPLGVIGALLLAANARQAGVHQDRSLGGESLAIVGLTMTAPAGLYVASGRIGVTAVILWLLSVAYFASSVFYIKLCVTEVHARKEEQRRRARWQCVGYHAFLLLSLLTWAITSSIPLFLLIAFGPILVRTTWRLLRPAKKLSLKRIGLAEIAYSVAFLVFVVLAFRSNA
jgi:hypothetical protein